jgi:hypothetical protein
LRPKLFVDFHIGGSAAVSGRKAQFVDDEKKLPISH